MAMRVLVVGGAGYVGSIVRPVLEQRYQCRYFDRVPPQGVEAQSVIVGDVNDDAAVAAAVQNGVESILYMAMGKQEGNIHDVNTSLLVNVGGWYRFLKSGLAAGVRRFVYASSLSVYDNLKSGIRQDESKPPDAWKKPYGVSKRLGEAIGEMAAAAEPSASILALRLMLPRNDEDWRRPTTLHLAPMGPNDTRRLFLAALAFDRPGWHVVQTSGDLEGKLFPNDCARELLGWEPRGE
jgi:nucleoside-diphosphate-sugar epimerase